MIGMLCFYVFSILNKFLQVSYRTQPILQLTVCFVATSMVEHVTGVKQRNQPHWHLWNFLDMDPILVIQHRLTKKLAQDHNHMWSQTYETRKQLDSLSTLS